jgi:2,4-dienoyl-CoA reductase-like NADH-dependent reductase (Old Yellow Enzyme family)
MASLFSPGRIGSLELKNRMIRTASHEGLADARGAPTEAQAQFYERFVEGGIGLVITGYAGIQANGKSSLYHMTMIDSDELVPAHRTMVNRIHAAGGRIALQIAHCGRQTTTKDTCAPSIVAPSPMRCVFYCETPREITEPEIYEAIGNFARAARRAKVAGYDAVEVHGAHGYLLCSFLSRAANRRTDQWGGSAENRFRIVALTLRAVRDVVGPDYPVLIKLNSYDSARNGIRPEECVEHARRVEATGCCDAIEISAGTNANVFYMARGGFPVGAILQYCRPFCELCRPAKLLTRVFVGPVAKLFTPRFIQGYNLETAAHVKKAVSLPVITVGGMRTKAFMDAAIADGKTDFVSMARPLLLEPDLANKFRDGVSDRARCDNCNVCLVASDTLPIRCHSAIH